MRSPETVPSALSSKRRRGELRRTSPPRASMYCRIGSHSRCGWLPSRNAICRPLVSLRKRFMAVRITVMDSLSGSIKSSALAMAMKTCREARASVSVANEGCWVSRTRLVIDTGREALLQHPLRHGQLILLVDVAERTRVDCQFVCEQPSAGQCTHSWPPSSMGTRGGAVCSFSGQVSIFWLLLRLYAQKEASEQRWQQLARDARQDGQQEVERRRDALDKVKLGELARQLCSRVSTEVRIGVRARATCVQPMHTCCMAKIMACCFH